MNTKVVKFISIFVPILGFCILLIPLFMYLANVNWIYAYETFLYIILSVVFIYTIYNALFNFKTIKTETNKALFYVSILLEALSLIIAVAILVYVFSYEIYY